MNQFSRAASLLLLTATIFLAPSANAAMVSDQKDLHGAVGFGFTKQMAVTPDRTLPALSAKYYMSKFSAVALGVGFDTKNNDNALALGLKGFKNVFLESNLIFYIGLGAAYVNHSGNKLQGSAFFGSEFFFDRLPSLGFSFEAGVRGDNTSGSFAIKTIADSFLTAGMHFYL